MHSDTRITATTPAGAGAGTVNVRVFTPGGTSHFVNYVVEVGETTADWYLSSDVNPTTRTLGSTPAGSTVHADWWTGWHRETNQLFLDNCVNFRTSEPSGCGFGYLTNGGPDGNNPYPGPALKMRQQFTGPSKVPSADLHRQLCPGGGNRSGPAAAYCRPGAHS